MNMQWNKVVLSAGMMLLACTGTALGEAHRGGAWNTISQNAILSVRNDENVRWIPEQTKAFGAAAERVAFLENVIAASCGRGGESSDEKSAALWLLGACGGREAVPLLLANLEWKDEKRGEMPALVSLVVIGEDAVEGLLGVVRGENETDVRKELAVDALEGIKGVHFGEFVREQEKLHGENAGLELFMNAVD